MKTLLVSEIYGPVIQGEGPVVGVPTVFVRLGGCDYNCGIDRKTEEVTGSFVCDSLYAVLPRYKKEWRKLSVDGILEEVSFLSDHRPVLVTLSGGNPALQDCRELIYEGRRRSFTFAIETQGSKAQQWFAGLQYLVISPKPPSSKMSTNWEELDDCIRYGSGAEHTALKVVVFDDDDFEFARKVKDRYSYIDLYLQAGTNSPYRNTDSFETMSMFRDDILKKLDWLSQKVIENHWYNARVLPQVHALIHGAKRGV